MWYEYFIALVGFAIPRFVLTNNLFFNTMHFKNIWVWYKPFSLLNLLHYIIQLFNEYITITKFPIPKIDVLPSDTPPFKFKFKKAVYK